MIFTPGFTLVFPPGSWNRTNHRIQQQEMGQQFNLQAPFTPSGDQAQAIDKLVQGIGDSKKYQVLLGVTGSGKTFTIANVIQEVDRPTLILSHNKTLAAQLYGEFKHFFPENVGQCPAVGQGFKKRPLTEIIDISANVQAAGAIHIQFDGLGQCRQGCWK